MSKERAFIEFWDSLEGFGDPLKNLNIPRDAFYAGWEAGRKEEARQPQLQFWKDEHEHA